MPDDENQVAEPEEQTEQDQAEVADESSAAESEVESNEVEGNGGSVEDTTPTPDSGLAEISFDYSVPELNDLARELLQPISDSNPCGESEEAADSVMTKISTGSGAIFDSIKSEGDDILREVASGGLNTCDLSAFANPTDIIKEIKTCMGKKCKSVLVAANLPYLLMIQHGPEGFAAGLDVVRHLVERLGESVFPHDKEKLYGFLSRGVYLVTEKGVITEYFRLFLYSPITDPDSANGLPFALLRNSKIHKSNSTVEASYNSDAAKSNAKFYVSLVESLEKLVDSAKKVNEALTNFLGKSPGTCDLVNFEFVESIEQKIKIVTTLATENCSGYPPIDEVAESAAASGVAAPGVAGTAVTGDISSRDQAIELLRRIADFFHRTERHSPVSYSLRNAVRWTSMDLPELMQELLEGQTSPLEEFGKRVGIESSKFEQQEHNDESE